MDRRATFFHVKSDTRPFLDDCPSDHIECPPGQELDLQFGACMCPDREEQEIYTSMCYPIYSPCFHPPCEGFDSKCVHINMSEFECVCSDGSTVQAEEHCATTGISAYDPDPRGTGASCFVENEGPICICKDSETIVDFLVPCPERSYNCPDGQIIDFEMGGCKCPEGLVLDVESDRCIFLR